MINHPYGKKYAHTREQNFLPLIFCLTLMLMLAAFMTPSASAASDSSTSSSTSLQNAQPDCVSPALCTGGNYGYIQGYVTDQNGAGITGIVVVVYYYSNGVIGGQAATATTQSGGYYIALVTSAVTFLVVASPSGYTTDQEQVSVTCLNPCTFNVNLGIQSWPTTWVDVGAAFTSTPDATLSWTQQTTQTYTVNSYVAGNGFTASYTIQGSQTLKAPAGKNLIVQTLDDANAKFLNKALQNAWIQRVDPANAWQAGNYASEYLNPNGLPSGGSRFQVGLDPGYSDSFTHQESGSLILQAGMDVSVSFGVPVSVGVNLQNTVAAQTNLEQAVTVYVLNTHTVHHTYQFYLEGSASNGQGGMIVHVWRIS